MDEYDEILFFSGIASDTQYFKIGKKYNNGKNIYCIDISNFIYEEHYNIYDVIHKMNEYKYILCSLRGLLEYALSLSLFTRSPHPCLLYRPCLDSHPCLHRSLCLTVNMYSLCHNPYPGIYPLTTGLGGWPCDPLGV